MGRGCQWTFFFPLAAPIELWVGKRNSDHDFLEMAERFGASQQWLLLVGHSHDVGKYAGGGYVGSCTIALDEHGVFAVAFRGE